MYHILLICLYLISVSVSIFIFYFYYANLGNKYFMNPDNHIPPTPCYILRSPGCFKIGLFFVGTTTIVLHIPCPCVILIHK